MITQNRHARRHAERIARRTYPRGKLSHRAVGLCALRRAYDARDTRRAAEIRRAAGLS